MGRPAQRSPRRLRGLGGRVGARERASAASPAPRASAGAGGRGPHDGRGTQPQGAAARIPGRPCLAGRSLLLVRRPTGGMGGGGSALRVCADHRGGINWLSLSPDGQRLLTGSEDGTARLWSTADGQCCALLQGRPARPRPPTSRSVLLSAARLPQTWALSSAEPLPKVQPAPIADPRGRALGGVGVQRGLRYGPVSRGARLRGRRSPVNRWVKSLPSPQF